MPSGLRLVLDTNVLLAGLVSQRSASQRIVDALQARVAIPLLSNPVIAEYRAVLLHPAITARFEHLTRRRVELVIQRLRYIGDELRVTRTTFPFTRDPRDSKFLELAIAGKATHLVTMDDDLLSLSTARTDDGRRFRQRLPSLVVTTPSDFAAAI